MMADDNRKNVINRDSSMHRCILAVDVGSTNLKATLLTYEGRAIVQESCKTPLTDQGICVEGSALQLYEEIGKLAENLILMAISGRQDVTISAICLSSQMASLLCLDENMEPLGDLIYGIDTRGNEHVCQMADFLPLETIYRETGCPESGIYWPGKLLWLQKHYPERLKQTRYLAGAKEYLLYRLTGNLVTDRASASTTGIYHQEQGCWWPEMLSFLGIKHVKLPEIREPWEIAGMLREDIARKLGINSVPVLNGSGDGPVATISSGAVTVGDCCISFGTTTVTRLVTDTWLPQCSGFFVQHFSDGVYLQGFRMNDGGRAAKPYIEASGGVEQSAEGTFYTEGKFWPGEPSTAGGKLAAVLNGTLFEVYAAMRPAVESGLILRILPTGGGSKNRGYMKRVANLFGVPVIIREDGDAFAGLAALVLVYEKRAENLFDAVNQLALSQEYLTPEADHSLSDLFQQYLQVTGRKVGARFDE